jgi:hypothetical protein
VRTLLIEHGGAAPDEVRDIVERGSTEVLRAHPTTADDVDRVVIWDAMGSHRTLTPQGSRTWPVTAEVFIVSPEASGLPADAGSTVLAWPADADRLKMAFMTGG